MGLETLRLSCLGSLAGIEFQRSPDEALHLLKEIENVCRERNDLNGLAASLGNQANVRMAQRLPQEALELQQQALEFSKKLGLSVSVAEHQVGLATCLHALGKWEESLAELKQAEHEFRRIGLPGPLGSCLGKQANILAEKGRLDEAIELTLETERCLTGSGQEIWLATCLFNLTRFCLVAGRIQLGLQKGREALSKLEQCGAPLQMREVCSQVVAELMRRNNH
jgi:tetratricopeptide (TPR) repeat protein